MHLAFWMFKATDTNSEYEILIDFRGKNVYANAPHYYITRTLPILGNSSQLQWMRLDLAVGSMWLGAFLSCYLRTGSDPVSMSLCSSWNIKCWTKSRYPIIKRSHVLWGKFVCYHPTWVRFTYGIRKQEIRFKNGFPVDRTKVLSDSHLQVSLLIKIYWPKNLLYYRDYKYLVQYVGIYFSTFML